MLKLGGLPMFKFGIIGPGGIANKFCGAFNFVDNACVAAVASKDPERAAQFAEKHGIPKHYSNYSHMLEQEKLDAVYISTTNNFHVENMMLCIGHGVPVLCEKPLALTEKDASAVFDAANKKGVFIMEAMWARFLPAFRRAVDIVRSSTIGDVRAVYYNYGWNIKKGRTIDPALGGGILYDIGVYAIDAITDIINREIKELKSMVYWSRDGVDLTSQIMFDFSGCLAAMNVTACAYMPSNMMIYGSKGYILLPHADECRECNCYFNDGSTDFYKYDFTNGFEFEIAHFIRCLAEGLRESNIMPQRDTLKCSRIYDLCLGTGR
jgi:predicted dehydrogenase